MPVPLHVTRKGPNTVEPVLLLHGFPFHQAMWQAATDHLVAANHHVILADLRGFGQSPPGEGPSTMEEMAADLLQLLDDLKLRRVKLGGFSMGGYVALEFIRRHPERVGSLFLCSTRAEPETTEGREGRKKLIAATRKNGIEPVVEAMMPKMLTKTSTAKDPALARRVENLMRQAKPEATIQALEGMMTRPDQRPHLKKIQVPTLVVVGAEDPITPPTASLEMVQHIPGSQIRIVTGAAHMVPLEAPQPLHHFLDHWVAGKLEAPGLSGLRERA